MYCMSAKYKERNEDGYFNIFDDYKYWLRPTIIDSTTDLFYRLCSYADNHCEMKVEADHSYAEIVLPSNEADLENLLDTYPELRVKFIFGSDIGVNKVVVVLISKLEN